MAGLIVLVLNGHPEATARAAHPFVQTVPLQRTIWYLTHLDGAARYYPNQWRYTPIHYTLNFIDAPLPNSNTGSNLRGEMQCNAFTANYETNDSQALTITLELITTVGCYPEDEIADLYWSRLLRIARYRIEETQHGPVLFLFDSSGLEILRFADAYIWSNTLYLPLIR